MVHKIINNKYRIFVETLILTIVIYLLGFSFGFFIENYRTNNIIENYKNDVINEADLRLQNYYYEIMSKEDCNFSIQENFIFADRIYNTGLRLEQYEEANQLTGDLLLEKKQYILLKTELWFNTILLKNKCGNPFDTVVYVYSNRPVNQALISEQKIISNVLKNLKEEKGNQIVLIPIAGDLDLDIVNLQLKRYNVNY